VNPARQRTARRKEGRTERKKARQTDRQTERKKERKKERKRERERERESKRGRDERKKDSANCVLKKPSTFFFSLPASLYVWKSFRCNAIQQTHAPPESSTGDPAVCWLHIAEENE